jgi:hypothetical protein
MAIRIERNPMAKEQNMRLCPPRRRTERRPGRKPKFTQPLQAESGAGPRDVQQHFGYGPR